MGIGDKRGNWRRKREIWGKKRYFEGKMEIWGERGHLEGKGGSWGEKNGEFGGKVVVKKKGGFLEKKTESGEK